jgi:hypothetical protein
MPNWTLLRLREKAKGAQSEGFFKYIEAKNASDCRKSEPLESFLARGGRIKHIPAKIQRGGK